MSEATGKVTLFTGQWIDLPLEEVARLAAGWGYDGLELACAGDHLDVWRAAEDPAYLDSRRRILGEHGLELFAISNHLAGQAVCDAPIDFRHQAILRERVWGNGDPEGVRARAAEEMQLTAKVARALGATTVVGFTGSSIWPYVAMFPPVPAAVIEAGYEDFARRFRPILDSCAEAGVRFALEVHPGEIAYDYWTAHRALEAVGGHPAFGFNWDPSHMLWQRVDPAGFVADFPDRIFHVHCKDARVRPVNGRAGVLSSHLPWGDPRRSWDFVSVGHGDAPWEDCFRTLAAIGYRGPFSVEWEDAGMDRLHGAAEAVGFVRSMLWTRPAAAFDAAFSRNR